MDPYKMCYAHDYIARMIEQINAVVFDTNAYRTAAYGKDRNGI